MDQFTKYAELIPVPDQTAAICAKISVTTIIARHGTPKFVVSDRGSQFLSELFTETCKLLKAGRICTSGYHPQSNMVETLHRTLHDSISHYVDTSGVRWDEVIQYFAMAYNGTPHTSTGYSPYYLMYGTDVRLPTREALRPVVEAEDLVTPSVRGHLDVLKQRFKVAFDKMGKKGMAR
jgi:transposase InsO family protein